MEKKELVPNIVIETKARGIDEVAQNNVLLDLPEEQKDNYLVEKATHYKALSRRFLGGVAFLTFGNLVSASSLVVPDTIRTYVVGACLVSSVVGILYITLYRNPYKIPSEAAKTENEVYKVLKRVMKK